MIDIFEFFFGVRPLQAAGGFGPLSGLSQSKQDPTPCKIPAKGAKERLRDELRELFPELQSGIILEVPAAPKARHDKDHHSSPGKARGD